MTRILKSEYCDFELSFSDTEFTPHNKKPTMAIRQGNTITKVATFNNAESFEWFLGVLGVMFRDNEV